MSQDTFYLIKITSPLSSPELELITGGWAPVSETFVSGTGICVFTSESKAEAYAPFFKQMMANDGLPADQCSFETHECDRGQISMLAGALRFPNVLVDPERSSAAFVTVTKHYTVDDFSFNF